MIWYSDLYVGSSLEDVKYKIIKKIKQNKRVFDVYLLALPVSHNHLLELIPVPYAKPYPDLAVIGIAGGKQEAVELTAKIMEEVYIHTGAFDVGAYLKEKQRSSGDREPLQMEV